jgi:hypothetical protein
LHLWAWLNAKLRSELHCQVVSKCPHVPRWKVQIGR